MVLTAPACIVAALLLGNPVQSWPTPPFASRREIIGNIWAASTSASAVVAVGLSSQQPALAASATASVPTATELERLRMGHARVRYLLEHWDEVTSVCGTTVMSDAERKQIIRTEGGQQCTKTPLRVQEFMGYKSTKDPLYRADKLMVRAGSLVDVDEFENYLDVVERYREKADSTALLAYTSSWGEANP